MPSAFAAFRESGRARAEEARAGGEAGHLVLFLGLPVRVGLDVGVVRVEDDHLGRAPRGPSRFDRRGRAVGDLEEGEEAARYAASREGFLRGADLGEIGTRARAVFEKPGFAGDEVHDAALVDQVVLDVEDEAGVGLGPLVGRGGAGHLARGWVDVEMPLGRSLDAVDRMEAGIEPLGAVGRRHLMGEHVEQLVVKGRRVFLRVEVAGMLAPLDPGVGESMEDLARIHLPTFARGGVDALFLRDEGGPG